MFPGLVYSQEDIDIFGASKATRATFHPFANEMLFNVSSNLIGIGVPKMPASGAARISFERIRVVS